MKTSFLKRLKGLLALTLCAILFMGNGMTAVADDPAADYTYECHFYSYADSGACNSLKEGFISQYTYASFDEINFSDDGSAIDYRMLSQLYASGATVLEGGKTLRLILNAHDNDNTGVPPYHDNSIYEQFNVLVKESLVSGYSLNIGYNASDSKDDTITIGESGSYYIWTYDKNGYFDNDGTIPEGSRYSDKRAGYYLSPERGEGSETSPFEYNMYFEQVYDTQVTPESGTVNYKSESFYMAAAPYSSYNSLYRYAKAGDTVLVGAGSGATFDDVNHLEVRKYNADKTEYEVIPLSELQYGEYTEYDDCQATFIMPQGDISTILTTDEDALKDEYFVSRYSVAAKAATCTSSGNVAYLKCPVCEKYYVKDGDTWTEKEESDILIPATGHKNVNKVAAKAATCTKEGNIEYYKCTDCGLYFKDQACTKKITKAQTVIAKKGHTYVSKVTPATPTKEGCTYKECKVCKTKKDKVAIAKPVVTLKKSKLTYNKKVQTATVLVKDTKGKVIDKNSYTVTYANSKSKAIGLYNVSVKLKGNYSGTVKLTYSISPKTISLSKGDITKSSIKLNWKANTSVNGYEIQYSTDKNFKKDNNTIKVKGATKTTATISKLKAGKTYYFRARTYTTVKSDKITSEWSDSLKLTTKKK